MRIQIAALTALVFAGPAGAQQIMLQPANPAAANQAGAYAKAC